MNYILIRSVGVLQICISEDVTSASLSISGVSTNLVRVVYNWERYCSSHQMCDSYLSLLVFSYISKARTMPLFRRTLTYIDIFRADRAQSQAVM